MFLKKTKRQVMMGAGLWAVRMSDFLVLEPMRWFHVPCKKMRTFQSFIFTLRFCVLMPQATDEVSRCYFVNKNQINIDACRKWSQLPQPRKTRGCVPVGCSLQRLQATVLVTAVGPFKTGHKSQWRRKGRPDVAHKGWFHGRRWWTQRRVRSPRLSGFMSPKLKLWRIH